MTVTIKYIGLYSDLAGTKEEIVEVQGESTTAKELAITLCERFGPEFEHVTFEKDRNGWEAAWFINGRAAALATPIRDGDTVTITYRLEGG